MTFLGALKETASNLPKFVFNGLKENIQDIGSGWEDMFNDLITTVILPPQPKTSAKHLPNTAPHGGGAYNGMWEAMYQLNDAFTNIALQIFAFLLLIWLIQIGIGAIDLQEVAESFWMMILTIIFIIGNEEIVGIGWAFVYTLSNGILRMPVGGSTAEAVGGGLTGGALAIGGITAIANPATGWIIIGVIVLCLVLFMTFLLFMFFVQLIALIGYGIFPILALLIGAGEVFDKGASQTKKLTGFFVPPMWCPIMFAAVFKVADALARIGSFQDGSVVSGAFAFLMGPILAVGTGLIGTWVALQQFKAGQFAVKAGTSAIMAGAGGALAIGSGAGLGSALKGYARGGSGKSALAQQMADSQGEGAGPNLPGMDQDQYDEDEEEEGLDGPDPDSEEYEEMTESDELSEFEPDEEEEEEEEQGFFEKGPLQHAKEGAEDKIDEGKERMEDFSDRLGSSSEQANHEDVEQTGGVFGGVSNSLEGGKKRFRNALSQSKSQIANGSLGAQNGANSIAEQIADRKGLEGEDREDFLNQEAGRFENLVEEENHPGITDNEAEANAFDRYAESFDEEDQAMLGNSRLMHGDDFDPTHRLSDARNFGQIKSDEARRAMQQDPRMGNTDLQDKNYDENDVFFTDHVFGDDEASQIGQRSQPMSEAENEHGIVDVMGETEELENGNVALGIDSDQIGGVRDLEDALPEEMYDETQMRDDGRLELTAGNAADATQYLNENYGTASKGIKGDKGSGILMEKARRKSQRVEASRVINRSQQPNTLQDQIKQKAKEKFGGYTPAEQLASEVEGSDNSAVNEAVLQNNSTGLTGINDPKNTTEEVGATTVTISDPAGGGQKANEMGMSVTPASSDEETPLEMEQTNGGVQLRVDEGTSKSTRFDVLDVVNDNTDRSVAPEIDTSGGDGTSISTYDLSPEEARKVSQEIAANGGSIQTERAVTTNFEQQTNGVSHTQQSRLANEAAPSNSRSTSPTPEGSQTEPARDQATNTSPSETQSPDTIDEITETVTKTESEVPGGSQPTPTSATATGNLAEQEGRPSASRTNTSDVHPDDAERSQAETLNSGHNTRRETTDTVDVQHATPATATGNPAKGDPSPPESVDNLSGGTTSATPRGQSTDTNPEEIPNSGDRTPTRKEPVEGEAGNRTEVGTNDIERDKLHRGQTSTSTSKKSQQSPVTQNDTQSSTSNTIVDRFEEETNEETADQLNSLGESTTRKMGKNFAKERPDVVDEAADGDVDEFVDMFVDEFQ